MRIAVFLQRDVWVRGSLLKEYKYVSLMIFLCVFWCYVMLVYIHTEQAEKLA